ncbi:ABC transporter substrate binding protein [Bdellovibrio bacteriovorus W]|nr:ABC transporter substrate binding protein [Bdellovibrio bacteriovorus W]
MESPLSTQIKVGLFLSIGIIVVLGSIFFLGADKALFTTYVRLHAHFDQVQGLSVGSVVSLSGVTVGNVEAIKFIPEKNALDVKMRINEEFIDRIRQGSEVEVRTQGALGDKYVFIIPGNYQDPVVKEGEILAVAKPTDIIGVISERGNEANRIFDVINELYAITHAMTVDNRIGKIMANLENVSEHLRSGSKNADILVGQIKTQQTTEKIAQSLEKVESILAKIDRGQGSLGALINDPAIHNQLKAVLGGSSTSNSQSIRQLLRTSIQKERHEEP